VNARFTVLALMILMLLLLLLLLLLPLLVSYQSLLLLGLFFFFLLTGQEVTGQPLRGGHERAFSALHGLNKPVRKPAKNGHLGQVLRVPQNRVRDVGYYHFSRLLLYVRALAQTHQSLFGCLGMKNYPLFFSRARRGASKHEGRVSSINIDAL
jgi:hypothetical protein